MSASYDRINPAIPPSADTSRKRAGPPDRILAQARGMVVFFILHWDTRGAASGVYLIVPGAEGKLQVCKCAVPR